MTYTIKNWFRKHTLRGRVGVIEKSVGAGDPWSNSVKHNIGELTSWASKLQSDVNRIDAILKDSGIVEDVDVSDIKFKETKKHGMFADFYHREAYTVNQVKTK